MSVRIAPLALLVVVMGLVACASGPSSHDSGEPVAHLDPGRDPYWGDQEWDRSLFKSVQSVVRYPSDAADQSAPSIHGVVKFTVADGKITYPEIVQSTGDPDLDKTLLRQIASASVPPPIGLHAAEPHEFALQLDMPTRFEALEDAVDAAIDYWKVYPKDAILEGVQGSVTVGFDYLDGTASKIAIVKSSKVRYLDAASLRAVSKANLPPPPPYYAGQLLHMQAMICYSLNNSNVCPAIRHSVQVTGTIVRR